MQVSLSVERKEYCVDDILISQHLALILCSFFGVKYSVTGFSNRVLLPLGVKFQLPKKIPGPVLM